VLSPAKLTGGVNLAVKQGMVRLNNGGRPSKPGRSH